MSQPSTDREILRKGLVRLGLCVPLMFLGPILISLGFRSEHPVVFLFPGIAFALLALYLMFRGIMLILDAMFKTDQKR